MLRDIVKHKTDLVIKPLPDLSDIKMYQIEDKNTGEKGGFVSEGVYLDETSWIEPHASVICIGAYQGGRLVSNMPKVMLTGGTVIGREAKVFIHSGRLENVKVGSEAMVRSLNRNIYLANGELRYEGKILVSREEFRYSAVIPVSCRIEDFKVEDHGEVFVDNSLYATHLNVGKGGEFTIQQHDHDSICLVNGVVIDNWCTFRSSNIKNMIIRELALVGENIGMEYKCSDRNNDNVRLIIKEVVVNSDNENVEVIIADKCDAIWTNYNSLEYDWAGEYLITKTKIMDGGRD